ncbi:hypothetical protein VUR80DRAFT_7051 [Thermomyces stellatus]
MFGRGRGSGVLWCVSDGRWEGVLTVGPGRMSAGLHVGSGSSPGTDLRLGRSPSTLCLGSVALNTRGNSRCNGRCFHDDMAGTVAGARWDILSGQATRLATQRRGGPQAVLCKSRARREAPAGRGLDRKPCDRSFAPPPPLLLLFSDTEAEIKY